jgi:hypothetical protein
MWRCAQLGQRFTALSEKKLGIAHRQTAIAVSKIAAAFQFEMYSMDSPILRLTMTGRQ